MSTATEEGETAMHPATATRSEAPPLDDPMPQAELMPQPAAPAPAAIGRSAFTSTPTIGHLVEALALAQLEFGTIEKDLTAHVESKRTGAKYTYGYADLANVLAAVRPALAKHQIATLQPVAVGRQGIVVTTLLAHPSGEYIRNDFALPLDSTDPQAIGSAITYARRYALQALLGVAPEDDDDAQAAGGGASFRPGASAVQMPQRAESAPPTPRGPAPTPPTASPASRPGPVPVTTPGLSFVTVTAVDERKTSTGKKYWVAAFSDGRVGCTFSTTMEARLVEARDYQTRFSRVTLSTKGNWTYIDVLEV
jgi:hypothetical protein